MRGYVRIWKLYGRCLLFLALLSIIAYLLFSTPAYLDKSCDPLNSGNVESLCQSVFEGEKSTVDYASKYAWCRRRDVIPDDYYQTQLPGGCQKFIRDNGYMSYNVTSEEREFPIAFSILMHENVEQVSFH
jgi:hypothetical protein